MKHLLTTAIVALAATVLQAASPAEATRSRRVPVIEGDGTTLYGEVTHSNAMDVTVADGLKWGLYSFNASSPMTVKPLTIHNSICANGGGTYRKGKLYFTSYYEDMTGALGYLYFIEMNLADYSIERHALVPDTYDAIAADMTYDPVGDKIYGVSFDPTDYNFSTYILVDYDLSTGYPTKVASIARMSAIACDNLGQMWGVRYSDGKLVKINKLNGDVTEVGNTGVNPIYNGSACFDYTTGKLYWSTNERTTENSGLYQIDTTTGAASLISLYPDNESVAALYIPQRDDINMLNPVSGLTASFEGSSLDGTISFTAPSTDISGNAIDGKVTVAGYLDGTLNFSIMMNPGESTTRDFTLAQGMHHIEVIATHPTAGKSERVSLDFYVGSDGPAGVKNLTAEKISGNQISLTWETPTEGEHGGTINPALTYYKIVRFPDNKVLTEEATGTSYTDKVTSDLLRLYTYQVTGYYRNLAGATVESNEVEMGQPAALPYLQTFDTMQDYATFVVRDDNKDPDAPGEGLWGWHQDKQCAAYAYHTFLPGDDWLITPGYNLDAGRNYRLKFKTLAGRLYPETLEVKIGRGYKAAQFTQTLMPRTDILSPEQEFEEREIVFTVPETGNYYIGFHAVSVKGQFWLYLDDVALEEGTLLSTPAPVEDFAAVPGQRPKEVKVSFTAPSKDMTGSELSSLTEVKVSRDGEEIKTLTAEDALEPGKRFAFTDTNVPAGMHTYTIVSSNDYGTGDSAEATLYAGLDIPKPVTDVKHVTLDGVNAELSWEAPTEGEHGGRISYETVKYRIVDQNGRVVANGLNTPHFTDMNIDIEDGQRNVYYTIYAYNTSGTGEGVKSDFITYGPAYRDYFSESFAGGKEPTTRDWIMQIVNPSPYDNGFYGRYFSYSHKPNDKDRGPKPEAQDGDGGMLVAYTDFLDVEARMISPKINVEGLLNPVLSFWFYHFYNPDTEKGFSTDKETMTVEAYVDGEFKPLTARPILLINGNGWYRYDLPLKETVGGKDFQIAFHTHNYISYDMHVDNITVHDVPDCDIQVDGFYVPEVIAVNSTRTAEVTVFNGGMKPNDNYRVKLYRDNELVGEQEAEDALEFAKSKTFRFEITPIITDAGKIYEYSARVECDSDEDNSNNATAAVKVQIPGNNLPTVPDLTGRESGGKVLLRWNEPEMMGGAAVTDGFESYEAFTITDFGKWSLYDNDGSLTYTISNSSTESGDYEYPNAGYQMAFQVFNPGAIDMKGKLWTPYLGNQMAVCFAAAERSNDDWLISPEVKGGTKVSFYAKSVVDSYGLDKFRFCYAKTADAAISEFIQIGSTVVVPAAEWTRYEFTLPENAACFAINCISDNTYAMLLDDVTYVGAQADMLEFYGYNVYRDGVKINDEIVEENEFLDEEITSKVSHTYQVTALYDKGESCLSNAVRVDTSAVSGLNNEAFSVVVVAGGLEIRDASGEVTVTDARGITMWRGMPGHTLRLSLEPGIYIVRNDNHVVKTIVK